MITIRKATLSDIEELLPLLDQLGYSTNKEESLVIFCLALSS
jgi:hypothetical protein